MLASIKKMIVSYRPSDSNQSASVELMECNLSFDSRNRIRLNGISLSDRHNESIMVDNIYHVIDCETGEHINPVYIGGEEFKKTISAKAWEGLNAIKALKFFTYTVRGLRARERERLLDFVMSICDLSEFNRVEVESWLNELWCTDGYKYFHGDTTGYLHILKEIPPAYLTRCKEYALLIAKGSGRKPISERLLLRIDMEFSENPVVLEPDPINSD